MEKIVPDSQSMKVGDEVAVLGTNGNAWLISKVTKITLTQIVIEHGRKKFLRINGRAHGSSGHVRFATDTDRAVVANKKKLHEEQAERTRTYDERRNAMNALFTGLDNIYVSSTDDKWSIEGLTEDQVKTCAEVLKNATT